MKLIQIYLDDETHTTLVKNYTIALAAAEESFTFEDYLILATSRISMSIYAQCSTTGNQRKSKSQTENIEIQR